MIALCFHRLKLVVIYMLIAILPVIAHAQAPETDVSNAIDTNQDNITPSDSVEVQDVDETQLFLNDAADSNIDISTIGFWGTVRIFFILAILLGIGIAIIWFLKRFQVKQNSTNVEVIDIVASRSLSTNSSLHIVKIAGSYILLGDSSQSIQLIKEYSDKEEVDDIELSISKAESEGEIKETFIQKLQNRLSQSKISPHTKIQMRNVATTHTSLLSLFTDGKRKGKL